MGTERFQENRLLSGRYEFLEVIGRGGMGTVYRALDRRLDTIVAVKEMLERDLTPEDREAAVRQFEREAKLLGQLSHRNLPRVTDYFVEEDHCYLIMEFVEGKTLETLLREAGGLPLPLLSVLDWGVQLADVLDYLHSQTPPIVFRDIKPANIMVQADGNIKLIDFGIARRFQSGQTKDTLLYGSPGYSPPEQYGRAQTDPRSDIYSLGATLHHLVTGRDPAPTPFKYPALRSLNPDLPQQLEVFIARCVEMEEELRCQSADEARETLLQIRAAAIAAASAVSRPSSGSASRSQSQSQSSLSASRSASAPRVISRRVAQADDARFLKRFVFAVIALSVFGALGAFAFKMIPKGKPKDGPALILPHSSNNPDPPAPTPHQTPVTPGNDSTDHSLATLVLKTIPAGATIYLDGKPLDSNAQEVSDVSPGRHVLKFIPPSKSNFAATVRVIEAQAGQRSEFDTSLQELPASPPIVPADGMAEIKRGEVQEVALTNPSRPGLRLSTALRIYGGTNKTCTIAYFFYAADATTPLKPRTEADRYANTEGQLSVSESFPVDTDPQDILDYPISIPTTVFPDPHYDQATYRTVIYLDGKPVAQTDLRPLKRGAQ